MSGLLHDIYPPQLLQKHKKVRKIEWITIFYLLSVVVVIWLVMGTSQAMKAAWFEDALSLIPAVSFLIGNHFYNRPPDKKFPFGHFKAFTIAFLAGSVGLCVIGGFLFVDSVMTLLKAEHPTIGTFSLFGNTYWFGWLMILALLYSFIPAMILGLKKEPLARKLNLKVIFTDAMTQKADWQTAAAAIGGIIGIGLGLWWADAAAAIIISVSILRDGWKNLKDSATDLLDKKPMHLENHQEDEIVGKILHCLHEMDWITDAGVRLRENGNLISGEAYVVPANEDQLIEKLDAGRKGLSAASWRIFDVHLVPVQQIPETAIKKADLSPGKS